MNRRCLKSHMVLHSDTEYPCRICDYTTKKQVLLKRHLLTQVQYIIIFFYLHILFFLIMLNGDSIQMKNRTVVKFVSDHLN